MPVPGRGKEADSGLPYLTSNPNPLVIYESGKWTTYIFDDSNKKIRLKFIANLNSSGVSDSLTHSLTALL